MYLVSYKMLIRENISLKPYNTFGIGVRARYFAAFSAIEDLLQPAMSNCKPPIFILGGGSNILFTKDFDGTVLKNEIRGIEELHEDEAYIYVKAGAGENWHQFVLHCIRNNWAGIENLSLIPGNVGAAPMQNIGAYGVELRDVFLSLEAFHLPEKKVVTFTAGDCEFGYRESIFKGRYKDQFVILNVTLRLRKDPVFHTSYGAIQQELERMGVKEISIQAISQAVITIRSSKLPDPAQIGNSGSFFKNPEITNDQFAIINKQFPGVVSYPLLNGNVKLAAGWLIEQCGWKGFRRSDVGVHAKQALVLVNYGHANGKEIYDLSEEILQSVKKKFGVELEREVNIV
jgi:UDP-N-acetylmuramate dehydrogenase